MSRPRPILDRLPSLYRNRGGDFLKRFVRVAEEGSSDFHARLAREEQLLDGVADVVRPPGGLAAGVSTPPGERSGLIRRAGTVAAIVRWLERAGPCPGIWPALVVSMESANRVRIARTWERSVVVAWTAEDLETPPDDVRIPAWLIPVGCQIQAVWLSKPSRPCPPFPGSVLAGREIPIRGMDACRSAGTEGRNP